MKRLDTATRNAIIADRLNGIPGEVVGRKYGIHEASVARLVSQFRRQTDSKAGIHQTPGDWRNRLKTKSIAAIETGLDSKPDKYKTGNLGVAVMKGIGEFEGERPAIGGIPIIICLPPGLAMPEGMVIDVPPEPDRLCEQSKPLALPEAGNRTEEPTEGKAERPPPLNAAKA